MRITALARRLLTDFTACKIHDAARTVGTFIYNFLPLRIQPRCSAFPSTWLRPPSVTVSPQSGDGRARCTRVLLCDEEGRPTRKFCPGDRAHFYYEFEILDEIPGVLSAGLEFVDTTGGVIHGKNTFDYGTACVRTVTSGTRLRCHQIIQLDVCTGVYAFSVGLASTDPDKYSAYRNGSLSYAQFASSIREHCRVTNVGSFEIVLRGNGELLHHGLVNLPGSCEVTWIRSSAYSADLASQDSKEAAGAPPLTLQKSKGSPQSRVIYLASYPRSGNTWARNLIKHYFDRQCSSFYYDAGRLNVYESAANEDQALAFFAYQVTHPYLATCIGLRSNCGRLFCREFRDLLLSLDQTFFVKTHDLPFDSYLPGEAVIYLVRHPAATLWSYYHFIRDHNSPDGNQVTLEDVIRGDCDFGSWSDHVEQWLVRGEALADRFVIIRYEDLAEAEASLCKAVSALTGLPVRCDVAAFPNFEYWNRSAPQFYRSGDPDRWRTTLSSSQLHLLDSVHGSTMSKLGYDLG
jgi:hypothetical protein